MTTFKPGDAVVGRRDVGRVVAVRDNPYADTCVKWPDQSEPVWERGAGMVLHDSSLLDRLASAEKLLAKCENHARWNSCLKPELADEIAAFVGEARR